MDVSMKGLCKCPYCFETFGLEAVHFKAETVFDQTQVKNADEDLKELYKMYLPNNDKQYDDFWNQFVVPPTGDADSYWARYNRHCTIGLDKESFAGLNTPNEITGLRDADGFLYGATDSFGKPTKIRICNKCHNPLPHEYGKYPVVFIAVVGITKSGKTVYLSQLLTKIGEFLAMANLTVVGMHNEVDDFTRKYRIAKNYAMPKGNATNTITLPLPLNVRDNITGKTFTMIFYDIAGENCVNPKQMEKYGKFIENANGIIMIVDPKQFTDLFSTIDDKPLIMFDESKLANKNNNDEDDGDIYRPEAVVQAMYNCFASRSSGGQSTIPLALTISKSDLMQTYFKNSDMHMFHNIDYSSYARHGFPKDDFFNINSEVRSVLSGTRMNRMSMQGKLLMDQLKLNFNNYACFAVSAVYNATIIQKQIPKEDTGTEGADDMITENDLYVTVQSTPETLRVEEPLFWLLHEMNLIRDGIKKGGNVKSVKQSKGPFGGLFGGRK